MKRILSAILAVVMMLSAAPVANIFIDTDTAITASAASYVKKNKGTYYAIAEYGLQMRKTASDSASVFKTIPKGGKVTYLGYKSGSTYWAYVYYPAGDCYGWVHASRLSKTNPSGSSASLSSSDKKYIQNLLYSFCEIQSYSSSASSAKSKAYKSIFMISGGAVTTVFDHYGWSYNTYYADETTDPKKYAKKYGADTYYRLSASKVDWILKNMYNVSPNHSTITKSDGSVTGYYSNGYYYYLGYPYMVFAGDHKITSCTKINGYYIIKGSMYRYDEGYTEKMGTFSAKLKLKTVDGKKVWSIYSYSYKNA